MNLARAWVGVTRAWSVFPPARFHWAVPSAIAILAAIAYGPFFDIPLLPDDYLQAKLAAEYGPPSGWTALAGDALYRCRATSLVLTWLLLEGFGLSALAFDLASLLLHIANALLVYSFGRVRSIGWKVSSIAAVIFATRERHHEAIVWFAAIPELLAFFFGACCVLAWLGWLDTGRPRFLAAALGAFALALLSKESAVVMPAALAAFAWPWRARRQAWLALVPFVALSALYTAAAFAARQTHLHFNDGTFSLNAPVAATLAHSAARGFWIWGGAALLVLAAARRRPRYLAFAGVWIVLALLPYSFLTYMPSIPSRHHYLASAGFALFIATAIRMVRADTRIPWLASAAMALYFFHQAGYLWISKHDRFAERARPIESMLTFMRTEPRRPVYVTCFPVSVGEAQRAVLLRLGEPETAIVPSTATDPPAGAPSFCYQ